MLETHGGQLRMGILSRREFAKLSSSAVVAGATLATWPFVTETFGHAQESAGEALTALSLTEASAKIRDKSVTSTQLTNAVLDRIAVYDVKVNSYITVMREEALRQAAQMDEEQKAGKLRGPLHGIPIALKDNIDTAGTRTTAASGVFQTRVPTEDADIVRRLKEAGAVIVGKLNLHEFAMGCTGDVSYFGPTRNPWALDHVTGGSSAGSGASVAADLCFGALGTDTGGSIRAPSAWCGIVGIKPTTGLVSIRGIIPCAASLDHCGPMARTVEDVAMMLGSMAGYDNLDVFSVQHETEDYLAALKQPVSGFRLGKPPEFYDHLEPEVASAVAAAIEVLSKLTAGVTSHKPMPEIPAGWGFFQGLGDTASYHEQLVKNSLMAYMPPTRKELEESFKGSSASAIDSARAHDKLVLIRRTVDAAFEDIDLVVMPTTRGLPPNIDDSLADQMGTKKKLVYDFFEGSSGCNNTAPFDVYGIPALSLPCGFSKSGLPIGLMIAGPHFSEGKVLALAYAYQQATDWHKRKPALTPSTPVPPIVEIVPPPAGAS
jgi:aspartyl-tRNA(Asn)/glutamyl-tRNA(Gln) amidotransferase subunit A